MHKQYECAVGMGVISVCYRGTWNAGTWCWAANLWKLETDEVAV